MGNWRSGSISGSTNIIKIVDANPKGAKENPRAYDIGLPSGSTSGSSLYGYDLIDVYTFSLRTGGSGQENSNKITINPTQTFISNLNPYRSSIKPLEFKSKRDLIHTKEPDRVNSSKLSIASSPSNYVDDFIINNLADYDLTQLYGKPQHRYSSSYEDLDTFRKSFFENYDIVIDNNKFIRGHEKLYNPSIIEAIKGMVPARSNLDTGIVIRQNILERQKIKHYEVSIDYGSPGINGLSSSIEIIPQHLNIESASYEKPISSSIHMDIPTIDSMSYDYPYSSSIHMDIPIIDSMSYAKPYSSSIDINIPTIDSMSYAKPYSSSIDLNISTLDSMSYAKPYSSSIDLNIPTMDSMSYVKPYSSSIDLNIPTMDSMSYEYPYSSSIHIDVPTMDSMSYQYPYSSSIDINIPTMDSMSYQYPYSSSIDINIPTMDSMSYEATKDIGISFRKQVTTKGKTEFTFADKAAETQFTFKSTGSDFGTITLKSKDGVQRQYTSRATSSAYNGETSGSRANAFIRFVNSASAGGTITLTSYDGTDTTTQKTYKAFATSSAVNGTVFQDFVVYSTGSELGLSGNSEGTASNNLMAAITSSNGHGTKLSISGSQNDGLLFLTQSNAGVGGNTTIQYTSSYDQFGTGSLVYTAYLHGGTDTEFDGGDTDKTHIVFGTGSNAINVADNFLAAVTSSHGHVDRFTVSKPTTNSVKLVQASKGLGGNTTITTDTSFNDRTLPNAPSKFGENTPSVLTFTFVNSASVFGDITLISNDIDDTEKTYRGMATSSAVNGSVSASFSPSASYVVFSTGSNAKTAADNLLAAITSSNGHEYKLNVSNIGNAGGIEIVQSIPSSSGNTTVTTNTAFTNRTSLNPSSTFVSGSDNQEGTDIGVTIDKSELKSIFEEEMSFTSPLSSSLNDDIIPTLDSMSYAKPLSSSIDMRQVPTMNSMSFTTQTSSIQILGLLTSSIVYPVSGTTNQFNEIHTSKFRDLHKDWGTGIDDTHFIGAESGSNLDHNTGHVDDRFVFRLIGDIEIQSASRNSNLKLHHDFSNIQNFKNRQTVDKGKGYTYKSFVGDYNGSTATASITFIHSASNDSQITLISTDGTSKTYLALSGSINGALSASSFVLYATGSGGVVNQSASAAGNLLAAITSSNGHGTKFSGSQEFASASSPSGVINLEQTLVGGKDDTFTDGNTTITYLNQSSLTNVTTSFGGGFDMSDGVEDGRPIGRTAYFSQSADGGTLFYPSNHYVNFSNDFSDKQWRGTQNTNPGFFNLQEQEDYSSASFYRVKVTTDNSLKIVRGKDIIDDDGNISTM